MLYIASKVLIVIAITSRITLKGLRTHKRENSPLPPCRLDCNLLLTQRKGLTGGERFVKFEVFGCIMSSTARRQEDRGSHRAYGRATSPYNNESIKEKMLRVYGLANSVII